MAIKVAISRKITKSQKTAVQKILAALTTLAVSQPGYLSGECLVSMEDPEDHLTLCSWHSRADWERFSNLPRAKELHDQVDQLLDRPTIHRFYQEL